MIEFMPESTGKIVGVRATGVLTGADYEKALIPRLETLFAEFGTLSILVHMDDRFVGWEMSAAWDDAAFGMKHRADFEKIAVVGGPQWVGWCIKCTSFLIRSEIRVYSNDQLSEAWEWVTSA